MHTGVDVSASRRVRLFIVTPIRLYRDGLAHYLGSSDRITVLGTAAEKRETVRMAAELVPDVVLLDMALDGSRATARSLRTVLPLAAIVALAVPDSGPAVVGCAEAGISGYVSREGSLEELLATVLRAHRGEATCSPRVAAELFRRIASLAAVDLHPAAGDPVPGRLTRREIEVFKLIKEGMSNQQIARSLHIELATVKNHVHAILEKLGARSRGEAVARAGKLAPAMS